MVDALHKNFLPVVLALSLRDFPPSKHGSQREPSDIFVQAGAACGTGLAPPSLFVRVCVVEVLFTRAIASFNPVQIDTGALAFVVLYIARRAPFASEAGI
jgi:hypothetical protein